MLATRKEIQTYTHTDSDTDTDTQTHRHRHDTDTDTDTDRQTDRHTHTHTQQTSKHTHTHTHKHLFGVAVRLQEGIGSFDPQAATPIRVFFLAWKAFGWIIIPVPRLESLNFCRCDDVGIYKVFRTHAYSF